MSQEPLWTIELPKALAEAQLPALPQSAIRLLELSQDPANGATAFAAPIESDPGLAGQVLRFVNSSYFGFTREISSVRLAISLVGIRTIKNFALWNAVFSLMPNPRCGPFDLRMLWQDSLRRALFARAAAKVLGLKETEEAFSAALLQDMAVPVLAKQLPDHYAKLLAARDHGRLRLSALEQRAFGWTHAQAAALMARRWNLPEAFALLVEGHVAVGDDGEAGLRTPGQIAVVMSGLLPAVADPTWHEVVRLETLYDQVRPAGSASLAEFLARIDGEYASFAPVLKVPLPKKTLVENYAEATAPAA